MVKKCFWLLSGGLILAALGFSVRWLMDGNLLFHSDIGRDFWLIKEVVDKGKLTLIGPRSGGISGMFHGPAWIYFNLPAYLLGKGNPLVVGWWWWICHLITIFSVYWVGKKMADRKVGGMGAVLYALTAALDVHSFNNPQGAVILAPWCFYFFWRFVTWGRAKDLWMSLFLMGWTIQFQIAFGGPWLILETIVVVYLTFKKRQWSWWWSYLALVPPLSTYLVFDIRHDWLQVNSLVNYVKSGAKTGIDWEVIWARMEGVGEGGGLMAKNMVLGWLSIAVVLVAAFWDKRVRWWTYLYMGYWLICLGFKGNIPVWYYSPFLPMMVVIVSLVASKIKWGWGWWLGLCLFNLVYLAKDWQSYGSTKNWTSWRSMEEVARWTYENCGQGKSDFGYFAYTSDLYGYSLKYAMDYYQRFYQMRAVLNEKKEVTCLVMGPKANENPSGQANWKSGDIRLEGKAVGSKSFDNGIVVEKYNLTDEEQSIGVNPNMIKGLEFR